MLCTIPMYNYCKVMLKRVYQTMLVYYSFFTHVYYILVKANVYIVYIICSSLLLLLLLIVLYCIVQNVCFTMYRIVIIVNTVHIYIYVYIYTQFLKWAPHSVHRHTADHLANVSIDPQ